MSPQVPLLTSPGWAMVEVRQSSSPVSGIVAGDEAAFVLEALAAVDAADDDAVRDARPARLGEALPVIGPRGLPDRLARPRVEGDDCRVVGGQVDLVPVEGDAAGRAPALRVLGILVPVLPEQLAGGRVEGLDDVAGARQEHHAVVDERRGLVGALGHRQRPGQTQAGHVVGPDPVQRRVALVVSGAPPGQPVLRRRIPEQLVGDRGEAGDFAVDERAEGRHGVHVAGLIRRRRVRRIRRGGGAPCRSGAGLADDGHGVRGERLRSRRMAVHLQQVGDDAQVGSARERSAEPRRHLGPHVLVQRRRGLRSPVAQKARTGQIRPVHRAPQRRSVAGGAGAAVGRPSACGLSVEERAPSAGWAPAGAAMPRASPTAARLATPASGRVLRDARPSLHPPPCPARVCLGIGASPFGQPRWAAPIGPRLQVAGRALDVHRRPLQLLMHQAPVRSLVTPRGRLPDWSAHRHHARPGRAQGRGHLAPTTVRVHLQHRPRLPVRLGALPRVAPPLTGGSER